MPKINSNINMDWPQLMDDYCKRRRTASSDVIKLVKMMLVDITKSTGLRVTIPNYVGLCGGGIDNSIAAITVCVIDDAHGGCARAVIDVSSTVVNNDLTPYAVNGTSLQRVYDSDKINVTANLDVSTRDFCSGGYRPDLYSIKTLRDKLIGIATVERES